MLTARRHELTGEELRAELDEVQESIAAQALDRHEVVQARLARLEKEDSVLHDLLADLNRAQPRE